MSNPKPNYSNLLMTRTFKLFSNDGKRDLSKTYIFACQHILRPREKMFPLFVDFGIPKENIFILGKAYSTNNNLFKELKDFGFHVYQPSFDINKSFDEQHKENCNAIFDLFQKNVLDGSRVIVLDDGAMMLSVFDENFGKISKDIEILGIEQTSSGFRKLEDKTLKFPIINVARSAIKLNKESPFVAESCLGQIFDYISANDITDNKFLVIGLGPIGQAIVDDLHEQGEKVFGFDISFGHKNLIEKIKELRPSIIVGATGKESISQEDIECLNFLRYPIYLISVSSSDREFPVAVYRKDKSFNINFDVRYGNIVFVNNGFPINFRGNFCKNGIEKIERTICLLMGSVLYLANNGKSATLEKDFIEVPEKITAIL